MKWPPGIGRPDRSVGSSVRLGRSDPSPVAPTLHHCSPQDDTSHRQASAATVRLRPSHGGCIGTAARSRCRPGSFAGLPIRPSLRSPPGRSPRGVAWRPGRPAATAGSASVRTRRSHQNRPESCAASGEAASQTMVSAPSAGLRRIGLATFSNPGIESLTPGGRHPPRMHAVHHRVIRRGEGLRQLLGEHHLHPLGPGVRPDTLVFALGVLEIGLQARRCTSRRTRRTPPGRRRPPASAAAARSVSSSGPRTWVAKAISWPCGVVLAFRRHHPGAVHQAVQRSQLGGQFLGQPAHVVQIADVGLVHDQFGVRLLQPDLGRRHLQGVRFAPDQMHRAPSAARPAAVAAPIPELPPVTTMSDRPVNGPGSAGHQFLRSQGPIELYPGITSLSSSRRRRRQSDCVFVLTTVSVPMSADGKRAGYRRRAGGREGEADPQSALCRIDRIPTVSPTATVSSAATQPHRPPAVEPTSPANRARSASTR